MAGLERGVLPVVGEAEQLPRLWLERFILAQRAQRREAEHRRRRTASLGGEHGQFAVVRFLTTGIGHRAVETKCKGRLDKLVDASARGFLPAGVDSRRYAAAGHGWPFSPGERRLRFRADPQAVARSWPGDHPLARDSHAAVQKACLFITFADLVGESTHSIGDFCGLAVRVAKDGVVFLSAFPTEGDWQQNPAAVTGHVLLSLRRHMPNVRAFQRCIDRVAAADELVQAKSEDGEACFRDSWRRSRP